jgi:hypothetical protein
MAHQTKLDPKIDAGDAALLTGSIREDLTARAINADAQYACLLSLQMGL